ncbi:hypothetical protein WH52_02360 [Tenacibaculum holothuriorum]|uniref:Uncharacterized protein n=1 Tax=Tenacibaculum holothuriorum TaxID=1635173 RepID=A0A1Y2PI76_9FLAO|nr:hypothetical protein [Tenacibaculum holothuriorum]OSY89497.1 hypothetical protein WH52_02360 [Tenacibaculum holothuriorum]
MKKVFLTGFIALLLMSFTFNDDLPIIDSNTIVLKIDIDESKTGWGNWNRTDCLRGLDFRVRNDGYNKYAKKYRWSIQFRNRYRDDIHFSYKAVAPNEKYDIRSSGRTTDRVHVDSGDTRGSYYLVRSGNSIYVYINKIRLGEKDYGYGYYDCDR